MALRSMNPHSALFYSCARGARQTTPTNNNHLRAGFLALVLVSLMVLHQAEGTEMEEAMMQVAKRVQTAGDGQEQLSAQVITVAGGSGGM